MVEPFWKVNASAASSQYEPAERCVRTVVPQIYTQLTLSNVEKYSVQTTGLQLQKEGCALCLPRTTGPR